MGAELTFHHNWKWIRAWTGTRPERGCLQATDDSERPNELGNKGKFTLVHTRSFRWVAVHAHTHTHKRTHGHGHGHGLAHSSEAYQCYNLGLISRNSGVDKRTFQLPWRAHDRQASTMFTNIRQGNRVEDLLNRCLMISTNSMSANIVCCNLTIWT